MKKRLKTQNSDSYKKSQRASLEKYGSCSTPLASKKKIEAFRKTSLEYYNFIKPWNINDSKAIKDHQKL